MNEITQMIAEELNKRLEGQMKWDETCRIFRIITGDIFVCVKDFESDWYNFSRLGIGENLVCAESIETFDKWSSCIYTETHPMTNSCFDTMVKNIKRLADPLYKELANMYYMQLNNDDIEEIYQIAHNEDKRKLIKDVYEAMDSVSENDSRKNKTLKLNQLNVGERFYIINGGWYGKIVEKEQEIVVYCEAKGRKITYAYENELIVRLAEDSEI